MPPMHDRGAFVAGLASLAVNSRIELTDPQTELYWTMLADLTDEDFATAVALCLQTSRYFPTIAELREKVTPYVSLEAEAGLAFERVSGLGDYSPNGYRWRVTKIAEVVGAAAAEAFLAAGGSRAFEQEQGEKNLPFLRRRFCEAFVEAAKAQRLGRQLAGAGTMRLPKASPMRGLVDATVRALSLPDSSR